jgi:hypothetical protein
MKADTVQSAARNHPSDTPARRCARSDRGEGAVSYLGVILLVAAIAAVLVSSGIGNAVADYTKAAVCRVAADDCTDEVTAGRQPVRNEPEASPGNQPGTGDDPATRQPQPRSRTLPPLRYASQPAPDDGTLTDDEGSGGGGTPCHGWECPNVSNPVSIEPPPPWENSDATPCWGLECEYVEDPLRMDELDPWHLDDVPYYYDPARFNWESDECDYNCGRFEEEIDRRVAACLGGPLGILRGAGNACDRNDMEHELVRDLERDFFNTNPEIEEALERNPDLGAPVNPANLPTPTITRPRLDHTFDSHAADWYDRPVFRSTDYEPWRRLIERASQSNLVVEWELRGGRLTHGYLTNIEGRWFFAQFDRATGVLATAHEAKGNQLRKIFYRLGFLS